MLRNTWGTVTRFVLLGAFAYIGVIVGGKAEATQALRHTTTLFCSGFGVNAGRALAVSFKHREGLFIVAEDVRGGGLGPSAPSDDMTVYGKVRFVRAAPGEPAVRGPTVDVEVSRSAPFAIAEQVFGEDGVSSFSDDLIPTTLVFALITHDAKRGVVQISCALVGPDGNVFAPIPTFDCPQPTNINPLLPDPVIPSCNFAASTSGP